MSVLDQQLVGQVRDLYVYSRLSESVIAERLKVEPRVIHEIIETLGKFGLLTRPPAIPPAKRRSW